MSIGPFPTFLQLVAQAFRGKAAPIGGRVVNEEAYDFGNLTLDQLAALPIGKESGRPLVFAGSTRHRGMDNFKGAALDTGKWDVTQTGSGMSYSVASGALSIQSGTTSGDKLIFKWKRGSFVPTSKFRAFLSISLRQTNQTFDIEWSNPARTEYIRLRFSGATATAATFEVSTGSATITGAATTTSTATSVAVGIQWMEDFARYWSQSGNTSGTISNTLDRVGALPDCNSSLDFKIVLENTGAVSNSVFNLQNVFLSCKEPLFADLENAGAGAAINSLPVNLTSTATVNAQDALSTTSGGVSTFHRLTSAATTNATSVKASAGSIGWLRVSNRNAAWRCIHFFNKNSAPTPGTDVPVVSFDLPPAWAGSISMDKYSRFSTGIAYCITASNASNSSDAIGAGDVVVSIGYA